MLNRGFLAFIWLSPAKRPREKQIKTNSRALLYVSHITVRCDTTWVEFVFAIGFSICESCGRIELIVNKKVEIPILSLALFMYLQRLLKCRTRDVPTHALSIFPTPNIRMHSDSGTVKHLCGSHRCHLSHEMQSQGHIAKLERIHKIHGRRTLPCSCPLCAPAFL